MEGDDMNEPVQQKFSDKVKESFDKLVKLEIKTAIGTEQNNRAIKTTIDLLQGDISTIIHDDFITKPELEPIYKFHLEREAQGIERVKGNIEAVKSALSLAKELALD